MPERDDTPVTMPAWVFVVALRAAMDAGRDMAADTLRAVAADLRAERDHALALLRDVLRETRDGGPITDDTIDAILAAVAEDDSR